MATQLTLFPEQYGNDLADTHSGGGAKINTVIAAVNGLKSGRATIALGADDVTVLAADLGFDPTGFPAFAVMAEIDATATMVLSAVVDSGDLVITADANATADVLVSWFIDARA